MESNEIPILKYSNNDDYERKSLRKRKKSNIIVDFCNIFFTRHRIKDIHKDSYSTTNKKGILKDFQMKVVCHDDNVEMVVVFFTK